MMTRTIVCQRCGIEGEIEVPGLNGDTPSSPIFTHVGHNPYSGHLHYQCPVCEIVLLVDPMAVLEDLISGYPERLRERTGGTKSGKGPEDESLWRRLFQNQQTGSC